MVSAAATKQQQNLETMSSHSLAKSHMYAPTIRPDQTVSVEKPVICSRTALAFFLLVDVGRVRAVVFRCSAAVWRSDLTFVPERDHFHHFIFFRASYYIIFGRPLLFLPPFLFLVPKRERETAHDAGGFPSH
jgi:hypothetical protein